jgi:hypothetical protein
MWKPERAASIMCWRCLLGFLDNNRTAGIAALAELRQGGAGKGAA